MVATPTEGAGGVLPPRGGPRQVPCISCGSVSCALWFDARDEILLNPGRFSLWRCDVCGLAFLHPMPTWEELKRYYPYWESDENRPRYESTGEVGRLQVEKVSKIAGAIFKPGRILDVGCGAGEFLAAIREKGWEPFGVEFSSVTSAFARGAFGLEVATGSLEDGAYPDAFFDCVTFWSVLEHLHDPRGTLREVARILRPAGMLVIQLPNIASAQARLFRDLWFHLNVPRHLYHFTPRALRNLLEAGGFQVRQVDFFSRTQNHLAYAFGLKRWLRFQRAPDRRRPLRPITEPAAARGGGVKRAVNGVLDGLFRPLGCLEAGFGLGGVMTVYAGIAPRGGLRPDSSRGPDDPVTRINPS